MKKILAVLLTALLLASLLASCAGSSTNDATTESYTVADSYGYDGDEAYYEESIEYDTAAADAGEVREESALTESNITVLLTEKIIYSYYANIETTEFDNSIAGITALLDSFDAFVENSYISGSSYYSNTTFRYAEYTIRVPVENFAALTGSLEVLGNIVSQSANADNITTQFTDVQARLDTYELEEERLLAMLEQAETVEDMITIESRLSDVRYEIESLTSTLRNWQNQVDYSTVSLSIEEVEELSTQVSAQRTYWERMWDGLASTFEGIGDFFKGLLMFVVVALPVIIILGVITIVIVLIVRASKKKKAKKNNINNIEPKE